jgi:hypothetical protein
MDDDPWANAWGDPQPQLSQLSSLTAKPSSWSFAAHENLDDDVQESDVGVQSWSTGVGVRWTDPSAPENSRWEYQSASNFWSASSTATVSNVSDAFPSPKPHLPSPGPPEPSSSHSVQPASSPPSPSTTPDDSSDQSEVASHDEQADTPDAFGTFEEAVPGASWAATPAFGLDNPDWDPAWGLGTVPVPVKDEQPPDEWEAARMAKEEQDSRVVRVIKYSLSENLFPTLSHAASRTPGLYSSASGGVCRGIMANIRHSL